jgi:hypothetical protein
MKVSAAKSNDGDQYNDGMIHARGFRRNHYFYKPFSEKPLFRPGQGRPAAFTLLEDKS